MDFPPDTPTVAVFAPHGRDGRLICDRLREAGLAAMACADADALGAALGAPDRRAGVIVLTEEALDAAAPVVRAATAQQPAWAELPVIFLARPGRTLNEGMAMVEVLGAGVDPTVLARPVAPDALFAVVHNAVAARQRQHVIRDLLAALRQSERAHRQTEERQRTALVAASMGVWSFDVETGAAIRSRRFYEIYGYEPDPSGATFRDFSERIHPADADRVLGAVEATVSEAAPYSESFRIVRPDGIVRWVHSEGRLVHDDAGGRHVTGVVYDVTEQARAKEALHQMNEKLETRVEERTRQVRELSRELTLAEQRERQRIAHILHDDLQQVLVAAKMATTLGHAEQLQEILDSALTLTRNLSHELSPPVLQGEDLEDMLRWLADKKRKQHGLEVEVEVGAGTQVPASDLRVLLYQLVRELLFNIVKHAGTNQARLVAKQVGEHICVIVEDRGTGFDLAHLHDENTHGLGLPSVRERLEVVGGTLEIESTPGQGTRVTISVPSPVPQHSVAS
jgi:PAS domain S-box-containing protein